MQLTFLSRLALLFAYSLLFTVKAVFAFSEKILIFAFTIRADSLHTLISFKIRNLL